MMQKGAMVNNWNSKHPEGTEVNVRLDNGEVMKSKTRSIAWMLGGHTPVILVEGISGAYALERVTAI